MTRTPLLRHYIGAVTLLGRIARHLPQGYSDQYGVDKAMRDANEVMRLNNVAIRFCKSSDGGFAAFDSEQVEHHNPYIERTPVPKEAS